MLRFAIRLASRSLSTEDDARIFRKGSSYGSGSEACGHATAPVSPGGRSGFTSRQEGCSDATERGSRRAVPRGERRDRGACSGSLASSRRITISFTTTFEERRWCRASVTFDAWTSFGTGFEQRENVVSPTTCPRRDVRREWGADGSRPVRPSGTVVVREAAKVRNRSRDAPVSNVDSRRGRPAVSVHGRVGPRRGRDVPPQQRERQRRASHVRVAFASTSCRARDARIVAGDRARDERNEACDR